MAKVDMSISLNAPAEAVWSVIRGFDALPRWHPAVARSEEIREGAKTQRKLILQGGAEIVEELEQHDNHARSYSYRILKSPLPVAGYRSELSVRDEGPGHCVVKWASTFEPSGSPKRMRSPRSAASTRQGSRASRSCSAAERAPDTHPAGWRSSISSATRSQTTASS